MLEKAANLLPKPLRFLATRFDRSPLNSVESLTEFVRTRSSYVAQTSMFGYLKARMGTQFPRFFEDAVFSRSIRVASARLYVTCLGDMTIFAVTHVAAHGGLDADQCVELAMASFDNGIGRTFTDQGDGELVPQNALPDFRARCELADWMPPENATTLFAASERDIVRFAPVIDDFKDLDREIVSNSIRFRWNDIRDQFRRRIDPESVVADWQKRRPVAPAGER